MLRLPLIATAVVVAALALLLPLIGQVGSLVSIVAALSFVVGAWCAPASYVQGQTGSLLWAGREVWTRRTAGTKTLQLAAGGAVVLIAVLLLELDAGTSAIIGIAAAIGLGAVAAQAGGRSTPRSSSQASSPAAQEEPGPDEDDAPARW